MLHLSRSTPSVAVVATPTVAPSSTPAIRSDPRIAAAPGWGVIARTARGVAVDQRWITVPGGKRIFVLRFRKGAVAFHFHVGSEDPPGADAAVPTDAQAAISPAEWRVGVLGVFNGGFKVAAGAGGTAVDGLVAAPIRRGAPTIVIDARGQLTIGTWGVNVPAHGDPVVAARQNLGYLVEGGTISASAADLAAWGVTLHGALAVARTGIGIDRAGNVLYAVGAPTLPIDLARALVAAGAVRAMQLDINPYWPIAGASRKPLHRPGAFPFENPFTEHSATSYEAGWLRDFFVVMAEPPAARCVVRSPMPMSHRVMPEPPSVACPRR
jgi:hypothetical protein